MNYKKKVNTFLSLHFTVKNRVECLVLLCPIWWPWPTSWPFKFNLNLIKMNWKFGCLVIWPVFQVPRATCGKWLLYWTVHGTLLLLQEVSLASAALDSWSFKLTRVWFLYLRKGKYSNSVLSCITRVTKMSYDHYLNQGRKVGVRIDGAQMTGHLL